MLKRLTDLLGAAIGIVLLTPVWLLVALVILLDDGAPIIFRQQRVGLAGRMFDVLKFRTMVRNAEQQGQLTTSGRDPRITRSGRWLRKYKLDELPQLFNVLKGDMSLVGPRPEVKYYVDRYNPHQRKVLTVRPGITDPASLAFIDENELLATADDPQRMYLDEVLPRKVALQLDYVENRSFMGDLKVMALTVWRIIR